MIAVGVLGRLWDMLVGARAPGCWLCVLCSFFGICWSVLGPRVACILCLAPFLEYAGRGKANGMLHSVLCGIFRICWSVLGLRVDCIVCIAPSLGYAGPCCAHGLLSSVSFRLLSVSLALPSPTLCLRYFRLRFVRLCWPLLCPLVTRMLCFPACLAAALLCCPHALLPPL